MPFLRPSSTRPSCCCCCALFSSGRIVVLSCSPSSSLLSAATRCCRWCSICTCAASSTGKFIDLLLNWVVMLLPAFGRGAAFFLRAAASWLRSASVLCGVPARLLSLSPSLPLQQLCFMPFPSRPQRPQAREHSAARGRRHGHHDWRLRPVQVRPARCAVFPYSVLVGWPAAVPLVAVVLPSCVPCSLFSVQVRSVVVWLAGWPATRALLVAAVPSLCATCVPLRLGGDAFATRALS
jgi:hypothetical protein